MEPIKVPFRKTCLNCTKRDTPQCKNLDEDGDTDLPLIPTQQMNCCELKEEYFIVT